MSKEKKMLYLNMGFGYIGVLLFFITSLRLLIITNDAIGQTLTTFTIICLGIFFRYVESKLLSNRKEKLFFSSVSLTIFIIVIFVTFWSLDQ